jgi:hypothetical protein
MGMTEALKARVIRPGESIRSAVRRDEAAAAELVMMAVAEHGTYRRAAEALGCTRASLNWAITDLGIRPQVAALLPKKGGREERAEKEQGRRDYIQSLRDAGVPWRRVDSLVGEAYGCSREASLQWRRRRGIG